MRRWMIAVAAAMAIDATANGAVIYKSVSKDGKVTYSDLLDGGSGAVVTRPESLGGPKRVAKPPVDNKKELERATNAYHEAIKRLEVARKGQESERNAPTGQLGFVSRNEADTKEVEDALSVVEHARRELDTLRRQTLAPAPRETP